MGSTIAQLCQACINKALTIECYAQHMKMRVLIFRWCLAVLLAISPHMAFAQQGQMMQIITGTGFFVSNSGHIITNQHVVDTCKEVELQGPFPKTTGKVIAVDEKNDLALIKTQQRTRRIATIRHPDASKLKLNEPVLVMGYPLDSYMKGEYKVAESKIIGLKGPTDEPYWIQFADSVQRGNSGGPLLDSSGNVAGVIVAKTELYTQRSSAEPRRVISKSDVAIALPILMRFLDKHYVAYRFNGSYSFMLTKRVEEMARAYIVNVMCVKPV
jgi:serine protease Do